MDCRIVALRALISMGQMGAAVGANSLPDLLSNDPVCPVDPVQARATLSQTEVTLIILGDAAARTVPNQQGDGRME